MVGGLKQYFKEVRKCKKCGIKYGTDKPEVDNNLCPYHTPQYCNLKKRKYHGKLQRK